MLNFLRQRLRTAIGRRLHLPEIPLALERLSQRGFAPRHILDVGAYRGDFARECLRLWPNARVSCFEPLPERIKELESLARAFPAVRIHRCLVGSEVSERVVLHEAETASSVLSEWTPNQFPTHEYPMETIDHVLSGDSGKGPADFLKIDVQGYELEVLKGAEKTLPHLQAILLEVNLLDIHKNVPLLDEIVSWMAARQWVTYDIVGLTRRPLDHALWQIDMIFVPQQSPLRTDKRWGV